MRILLVSAYELGHQPLHLASPAAALIEAGHEVKCLDLSVEPFDPAPVRWADAVACSVPMHTAFRLVIEACASIRALDGDIPLCLYGLYAQLAEASAGGELVDLAIAGEYEPLLVRWADELEDEGSSGVRTVVELGRGRFRLPARHLLPPLDRYARLAENGNEHLAGYVEASHGCAHHCRHCPVPVVYDGRTRLVGIDTILADIAQLADAGARHISFGDPDFLNGPHHAMRVVSAMHSAFGDLTFDVTAKVEHILAHRDLWPQLADSGCVFVVSAFESASASILTRLAKGHTPQDEAEAVAVLRGSGIEPRPSLLPFTPWTTAQDVIDILDLVAVCDLVGNVDPVQYSIRLLVPPGSLLLGSLQIEGLVGPYDGEHLGWSWTSPDPRLDLLASRLGAVAERAGTEGWGAAQAYDAVRAETSALLGSSVDPSPPESRARLRSSVPPDDRPRLTEAWFCCAEPTGAQLEMSMGATKR